MCSTIQAVTIILLQEVRTVLPAKAATPHPATRVHREAAAEVLPR